MDYNFLKSSIEKDNIVLHESKAIHPCLIKNNYSDLIKALDFMVSDGKFLYVHGFIGTGKRQFVNYLYEFLDPEVIKMEYYCKESTVCDDIMLWFTNIIDNNPLSKAININTKVTTLAVKFQQQISSIKKPFLIVLHSLDDVTEENLSVISKNFATLLKENNLKIIITTRALKQNLLGDINEDRKIFLKALQKNIFKDFISSNKLECSDKQIEDFYKATRGYYFYTALSIKLIQAMEITVAEFLQKIKQSETSFDDYLGMAYINLIPESIRNFFWFLKTIRHGISLNALAVFEIYDEFSIEYLKNNLIAFQADEMLYLHDYFIQKVEILIPTKTEIKLHKYIIKLYEEQIKASIKDRSILISRQALRSEIEYHTKCIQDIENGAKENVDNMISIQQSLSEIAADNTTQAQFSTSSRIDQARALTVEKKYSEAIEAYLKILEDENIDLTSLIEIRLQLARLYKTVGNYTLANHYYELVETYYEKHNEIINLNYLYYEMTDLYAKQYRNERAIETIKKVIYSVDTPQSLLVSACILLGNIYSELKNNTDAFSYYKKALESVDENVTEDMLAELYFKYALASDDNQDSQSAFEYYNKCIGISGNNPYKALAYSNLAACYEDLGNYDDASSCLLRAYDIEKANNNYDGIYYTASNIAQIYLQLRNKSALKYLLEAKSSAEFINDPFNILESTIALGDYYYNIPDKAKEALCEYFKAKSVANTSAEKFDVSKIERRIRDMKLRMSETDYTEVAKIYDK